MPNVQGNLEETNGPKHGGSIAVVCPLCAQRFDQVASYRTHLGEAHDLFDDEGVALDRRDSDASDDFRDPTVNEAVAAAAEDPARTLPLVASQLGRGAAPAQREDEMTTPEGARLTLRSQLWKAVNKRADAAAATDATERPAPPAVRPAAGVVARTSPVASPSDRMAGPSHASVEPRVTSPYEPAPVVLPDERPLTPPGPAARLLSRMSPGRSARRHPGLIALVVVAAIVCSLAASLLRRPVYTAEARLVVGKTLQLSNLAATPGLAAAGQQLAADYSRLVSTTLVKDDVRNRLGRKGSLGGTVSASPIPLSPVVRLEGKSTNAAQALAIANAGSSALVDAVNQLNQQQLSAAQDLLSQYQQADLALAHDQQNVASLQGQLTAAQNGGAPDSTIGPLRNALTTAQTQVDADRVKANALATDYQGTFSPTQLNEQVIQPTGPAVPKGNDRVSLLELVVAAAIICGLIVGVALATLIDTTAVRLR